MTHNTKSKYAFGTSLEIDQSTGQILAVYFRIRNGKAVEVEERNDGTVFINYDKHGQVLGVELLAPCSVRVFDRIAQKERMAARSQIKRYFRQSAPKGMIVTA